MSRRPCKTCGVDLIFATDKATGGLVPLDARQHPIYEVTVEGGKHIARRIDRARITHFVTCPHATSHSKKEEPKS